MISPETGGEAFVRAGAFVGLGAWVKSGIGEGVGEGEGEGVGRGRTGVRAASLSRSSLEYATGASVGFGVSSPPCGAEKATTAATHSTKMHAVSAI